MIREVRLRGRNGMGISQQTKGGKRERRKTDLRGHQRKSSRGGVSRIRRRTEMCEIV